MTFVTQVEIVVELWRTYNLKTGKVANPDGGWDDVLNDEMPPNPTNMQTQRALNGWTPNIPRQKGDLGSSKPRALGDLFQKKKAIPNQDKLRSRSVGRPMKEKSSVETRFNINLINGLWII